MWIVTETTSRLGNTHAIQHLYRPVGSGLVVELEMRFDCLGNLIPNCIDWIERGHGVLKDHRRLAAAKVVQLVPSHVQDILSLEEYLTPYDLAGWRLQQTQQRKR